MDDDKKKEKKDLPKRRYEKPSIVYEEKIEVLGSACGAISTEKTSFGAPNPGYGGTMCEAAHS